MRGHSFMRLISNLKLEVGTMRAKTHFPLLRLCFICCLLSVGIWIMPIGNSQAAVPDSINYQGKLIRVGGGPLNGNYDLTFSIYPDDLGSSAEWTETQPQVEVEHGVFSVLLGSVEPLPASLFDGSVKYLGVTAGEDSEMTPLRPMVTTSYAFHSLEADQAANADMLDDLHSTDFVQTSGDQTINGVKTFGSIPVLPAADPTSDNQAARKLYVDGQDATKIPYPPGSVHGDILYYDGSVWTRLPAGSSGQYLKTQGAGANPVWSEVVVVPADNSVSQAKLKTATGEVSTSSNNTQLILPGGEYGFYPQFKCDDGGPMGWYFTQTPNQGTVSHSTSYTTYIMGGEVWNNTIYARQRYVTASGRDHWTFLLINKRDYQETSQDGSIIAYGKGSIIAGYQAPDHPSTNQGGANELDTPHPFGSYDSTKHEIILIDNDILPELKAQVTSRRSLLTVINEDYEIDFDSEPAYQPREIIEIDEYGDKNGEILQRIKTPEWAKILIGKDEIFLRRRLVETLPDYVSYKKLRPKSNAISECPVLSQSDR